MNLENNENRQIRLNLASKLYAVASQMPLKKLVDFESDVELIRDQYKYSDVVFYRVSHKLTFNGKGENIEWLESYGDLIDRGITDFQQWKLKTPIRDLIAREAMKMAISLMEEDRKVFGSRGNRLMEELTTEENERN